jgi:hypothetical protein
MFRILTIYRKGSEHVNICHVVSRKSSYIGPRFCQKLTLGRAQQRFDRPLTIPYLHLHQNQDNVQLYRFAPSAQAEYPTHTQTISAAEHDHHCPEARFFVSPSSRSCMNVTSVNLRDIFGGATSYPSKDRHHGLWRANRFRGWQVKFGKRLSSRFVASEWV